MAKRQITYQKKYDSSKRPKMPITIIPNHRFDTGYDKPATKGTRAWWVELPSESDYADDRGLRMDEPELRALAAAIEAALDDADRSMEAAIREHNSYVEDINKRRDRNTEEAK